LKKRLITTGIGVPLVLLVMAAYATPVFDIVMLAALLIGYYEAYAAYGQKKTLGLMIAVSLVSAAALLGTAWGVTGFDTLQGREFCLLVALALLIVALIVTVLRHFQQLDIAKTAGMLLMCGMLFSCIYAVALLKAKLPFEKYGYLGVFFLVLSLSYAWGGDGLALIFGKSFGKRKLCPTISPNKTVAGAFGAPVGSILFGLLFLWLYVTLMPVLQPHALLNVPGWVWFAAVAAAIPASVIGMIGDLYFSCVKRQVGIKDYGWLFPGQGGIFDRFDSVIPIVAFVTACVCGWLYFCTPAL